MIGERNAPAIHRHLTGYRRDREIPTRDGENPRPSAVRNNRRQYGRPQLHPVFPRYFEGQRIRIARKNRGRRVWQRGRALLAYDANRGCYRFWILRDNLAAPLIFGLTPGVGSL